MQQRSVIMDKSQNDATNISSASHPIVGTFVSGSRENLLPASLYASKNEKSQLQTSTKEYDGSGVGFLESEIDYNEENIRIGGHD